MPTPPRPPRRTVLWLAAALAAAASACAGPGPESAPATPAAPATASGRAGEPAAEAEPPEAFTSSYYARWANGPSPDPAHFPIGVWLQAPTKLKDGVVNAESYRRMGVNTFVGLHSWPPDREHLTALERAGITFIGGGHQGPAEPRDAGSSAHVGHMLFDEPDMRGTEVEVGRVLATADAARAADPTRPVYVNFGKGVALPFYRQQDDLMAEYARACDICSVDYYPINDEYEPPGNKGIEAVGLAVDRLRRFTGDAKPVWAFVETTRIRDESPAAPTPAQARSEVWMALVHGARGIQYFAHSFAGNRLWDDALLYDQAMVRELTAVNRQVIELASVLNRPTVEGIVQVATADPAVPVDVMAKRRGRTTWVFAIGGRPGATHATFTVEGAERGRVRVLGEDRTLSLRDGKFTDAFAADYQVHLYEITR